jgi:hypothetical protein
VFLKGAREGWPVIGTLVRLVVKDEFEQRDRFMRENLDAMARKLGEMQAKVSQLESLGERVYALAGLNPAEMRAVPGQGGALVSGRPLSMEELQATLADLDRLTGQDTDLMTLLESRLSDQKIRNSMVPTQPPVKPGHGAHFGRVQAGQRVHPFAQRFELADLGLHLAELARHRVEVLAHEAVALRDLVLDHQLEQRADHRPALACALEHHPVIQAGRRQHQNERQRQHRRDELDAAQVDRPALGQSRIRDNEMHLLIPS